MSENSEEYLNLVNAIGMLERHFLPAQKVDGRYTDEEHLSFNAFIALAHSEIEYYFEAITRRIAEKACNEFQNVKKVSYPLLSLVCFLNKSTKNIFDSNKDLTSNEFDMASIVHASYTEFFNKNKQNNGISKKYIFPLLLSIGYSVKDIDGLLLDGLEKLAERRGAVAHTSMQSYEVTMLNQQDPYIVRNDIKQIIAELKNLDTELLLLLENI